MAILGSMSITTKGTINTFLGVVLYGAIVGVLVLYFLPTLPLTTDAVEYDNTASHLIETGEMLQLYDDGNTLAPGYPMFLAVIYALFGHDYTAVFFFQFMLVGICGALTFYLGYRYLQLPYLLALLAGALVTVWPYMVLHAMLVLSEIFAIMLLLVAMVPLLEYMREDKRRYAITSGVMLALFALTRPVGLLLPFWVLILMVLYAYITKRHVPSWKNGAWFAAAFLVPLMVWQGYLYASQGIVSGYFAQVPGVITKSLNLTYELDPPERIEDLLASKHASPTSPTTEEDVPSLTDIAVSKLKNIILFWNPGAGGYQAQEYIDRYPFVQILIWLYRFGFLVLLALAFMTVRHWKTPLVAYIWVIILYFWGVHAILFPYPRYMLPVVPLILILAFYTLSHMPVMQTLAQRLKDRFV